MVILIYIWLIFVVTFVLMFVLDQKVIRKLPEENKFRKWWKRHLIDDYPANIDW